MKKTLVYHKGRAPRGERSNWVMHEYKLNDDVLENVGTSPVRIYVFINSICFLFVLF